MKKQKSNSSRLATLYLLRIAISNIFLFIFSMVCCLIPILPTLFYKNGFELFVGIGSITLIVGALFFEFYIRRKVLKESERKFYVNTINEEIKEIKDSI